MRTLLIYELRLISALISVIRNYTFDVADISKSRINVPVVFHVRVVSLKLVNSANTFRDVIDLFMKRK